jgi:hypothetical protein
MDPIRMPLMASSNMYIMRVSCPEGKFDREA